MGDPVYFDVKKYKDDSDEQKRKNESQKQEARKAFAIDGRKLLTDYKNFGYFKLNKNQKINLQKKYKQIINYSLNEVLLDEEIEFLHLWSSFKDRHFGQTLIAQNEAQKPPAERGQSELANTIVSGIAMGNLIKANQLNEMREMNETMDEMAEDVEDVNEGFGFDE